MKKWFAIYTKSRCEKKVFSILIRKDIESWCPLQKVERQWSDRKKFIEDPVFKSYVFVRIEEDARLPVLQTEGVINFVHFLGKPAVIQDAEVALIKSYLMEKDVNISVQSSQTFQQNDKVIISHGIFMDNTGTVLRSSPKKIYVRLESLGQVMTVEFPESYVAHRS